MEKKQQSPLFVAHPGLPWLYQEFERCSSDKGFHQIKVGDIVILRAVFLPFSVYAPWDRVEGKVVALSKANVKVDVKAYMYNDRIWIPNWMIEDVIDVSTIKRTAKRKTYTARKSANESSEN